MAVATSTIAAGTALAGLGMSASQAVKAQKDRKNAQAAASKAAREIRDMEQMNAYSDLQVPTLGFELAQQGLDKSTIAALQTAQGAGAEGVIGGVGRINEAANAQQLKLASEAEKAEFDRDKLIASAQQDIYDTKFEQLSDLELSRLTGAQLEAYNAQLRRNQAIEGAFGSGVAALGYANDSIDLYKKAKDIPNLAKYAPEGTYTTTDSKGNLISTNVKPVGGDIDWMSSSPGLTNLPK